MKTNINKDRRQVLVWSAPVVAAVSLPAHAQTSPMLSLAKELTGGPNPATSEGDVLEYTITVVNTGADPINSVVVTDTMPDGTVVTLSSPTESLNADNILEIGETWTFATSYTVTMADLIDGADLVNQASVTTDGLFEAVTDNATVPVTQLRACAGPPVLSVLVAPKCAGNPPIGEATLQIFAPDMIPMQLLDIVVNSSDPASVIDGIPTLPMDITMGAGITLTWTGPASDAVTCLPLADITLDVEYACEDQVSLFETFNVTELLIASLP